MSIESKELEALAAPEPGGFLTVYGLLLSEPGGFKAISRWLSEERATPPETKRNKSRIPEGCQP